MTTKHPQVVPILLPARVAAGKPLRLRGDTDQDGGWTVVHCESAAHALALMRRYPRAEMPCWKRLRAALAYTTRPATTGTLISERA